MENPQRLDPVAVEAVHDPVREADGVLGRRDARELADVHAHEVGLDRDSTVVDQHVPQLGGASRPPHAWTGSSARRRQRLSPAAACRRATPRRHRCRTARNRLWPRAHQRKPRASRVLPHWTSRPLWRWTGSTLPGRHVPTAAPTNVLPCAARSTRAPARAARQGRGARCSSVATAPAGAAPARGRSGGTGEALTPRPSAARAAVSPPAPDPSRTRHAAGRSGRDCPAPTRRPLTKRVAEGYEHLFGSASA